MLFPDGAQIIRDIGFPKEAMGRIIMYHVLEGPTHKVLGEVHYRHVLQLGYTEGLLISGFTRAP
jgi:hypothetical protein